jgi:hypothetical protein
MVGIFARARFKVERASSAVGSRECGEQELNHSDGDSIENLKQRGICMRIGMLNDSCAIRQLCDLMRAAKCLSSAPRTFFSEVATRG